MYNKQKDQHSLVGTPASQEDQQQPHVQFHADYVTFIEIFGGAYAGIAVHAFSNGSSIGNETVVDLTNPGFSSPIQRCSISKHSRH
ncbi:hypothetical protein [Lysinibacillus sp. F5]|uniref:hypothetical protein n=1 Tax=Lysinibacillus sp. F5 TaxID=1700846 RepID=UPI000A5AFA13|nr:hypothetical protein [Lysinibacillus sp. F5]